jgi:hypothetical protein
MKQVNLIRDNRQGCRKSFAKKKEINEEYWQGVLPSRREIVE